MNILFVCEGFNSVSIVAQPWKHVYELATRMTNLNHKVAVLTDLVDSLPENESIKEISILRIKKGTFFFKFDKLLEAFNENRWDIINWFGGPLSALYFSRLRESLNKNIIWNMYKGKVTFDDFKNLSVVERFSLLRNVQFLYSIVPDFFIKRGSASSGIASIIVWSKRLKEYLVGIGVDTDKITIVSSGVDIENFKPISPSEAFALKKELGFTPDDAIALYFGNLSSFRGLDVLISAMNKIAKGNHHAKLLVLARDIDERRMDKFLKHATRREDIRVVSGIQSQSNVIKFLSVADAVVLPFKSWPHQEVPLTILEAMSMGKTVISTSIWPVLDFVQDGKTGVLVPPNDVDQLAEKTSEVLGNPKKSTEIGKAARSYVQEFHDWNVILKRTLEVYAQSAGIPDLGHRDERIEPSASAGA
ncbi:glycosyltransferase family 4 protein [Candidatus Bathyarchaeota archaeon]|nr:glycosyltransferase family 4 protein [Candidatus Bathyarchaeota archaeon]